MCLVSEHTHFTPGLVPTVKQSLCECCAKYVISEYTHFTHLLHLVLDCFTVGPSRGVKPVYSEIAHILHNIYASISSLLDKV